MIPTTLEIPSEYNIYNIIAENGKPFNTSNAPFEFVTEDECGNQTPYDITSFTFTFDIYEGNCLVTSLTNLFTTDTNKLYINEFPFDVPKGEYSYKVEMIGYNTVISGKITVK